MVQVRVGIVFVPIDAKTGYAFAEYRIVANHGYKPENTSNEYENPQQ
jgi:hypothetical protein